MLQALIIVRNKPFDEITWLLKIAGKIASEYSQLWLDKDDKRGGDGNCWGCQVYWYKKTGIERCSDIVRKWSSNFITFGNLSNFSWVLCFLSCSIHKKVNSLKFVFFRMTVQQENSFFEQYPYNSTHQPIRTFQYCRILSLESLTAITLQYLWAKEGLFWVNVLNWYRTILNFCNDIFRFVLRFFFCETEKNIGDTDIYELSRWKYRSTAK